jgi:hypothetical protein
VRFRKTGGETEATRTDDKSSCTGCCAANASFGNQGLLSDCEARVRKYLLSAAAQRAVKQLVSLLERQGAWRRGVNGGSGREGRRQLSGWTQKRRVRVLRPPREPAAPPAPRKHRPPCPKTGRRLDTSSKNRTPSARKNIQVDPDLKVFPRSNIQIDPN